MNIKNNDNVIVITGKDKGKTGKVIKVMHKDSKVIVEGINIVKKHQKPNAANPEGGIVEVGAPIHVSNVMNVDPETNTRTRVKTEVKEDNSKVRIAVKSGKEIK